MNSLLILDFDGVVADSEVVANSVLAAFVTELGVPTTLQDAYHRYMGKRFAEVVIEIELALGRAVPAEFAQILNRRTLEAFRGQLKPVPGVAEYLRTFSRIPQCIASSSSPDRLALCLEVLGMAKLFGPRVYSATMVSRGKPFPDIFLYAARAMGGDPARCIVIEDSASGVKAARAAGMTVIGLLAASHIQESHRAQLLNTGAQFVATTFAEAQAITQRLIDGRSRPG